MYKALVSFSGIVSMTVGEVRDIKEEYIVKDLLKAGYIEKVQEKKATQAVKKTEKK